MPKSYKAIFENNKKWVESKINPEYFHELKRKIQNISIGCSASVTAEDMIGAQPGGSFGSQEYC